VLTFAQFLQLQLQFTGGPSGARPIDNIPMGERGLGSPQTVYQNALKGQFGQRERMQFTDEKGTAWDMQWVYSTPLKSSSNT
jgi:hypothetical protein